MNDEKRSIKRPEGNKSGNRHTFYAKCDVRLTKDEDAKLSHLAELNGVTRSDVMRRALKDYWMWNTEG